MTKDMNVEYIIVQAGGRGSRMEHMTDNKPKALVPVDNLPMIFHLFKKYPDKKFLIIGDYHYEIFSHYLSAIKMENLRKNLPKNSVLLACLYLKIRMSWNTFLWKGNLYVG